MRTRNHHVLLAVIALASCGGASVAAPGTIAFTDVNVLPMDRETVLANHTVVVVDGVITEVGPSEDIRVGSGATVIDGTGRYLTPGLSEMHAHVPPGNDPPRQDVEDLLFLYIANGVTTIRGMLGSDYQIPLADELERSDDWVVLFYEQPGTDGQATVVTETSGPLNVKRVVRGREEDCRQHYRSEQPIDIFEH